MDCQKVTNVKGGGASWSGKKYCDKKGVIKDFHGRLLCQHHYNKWIKKIEKGNIVKKIGENTKDD